MDLFFLMNPFLSVNIYSMNFHAPKVIVTHKEIQFHPVIFLSFVIWDESLFIHDLHLVFNIKCYLIMTGT